MPAAIPARSVPRFWRLIPVAVFVALVWFRLPTITRHGRFWAEEGTDFFRNAAIMPWWQALLHPAKAGYLVLIGNLGGVLARHAVRLEDAPHCTMALGLAAQTLPMALLAGARDAWVKRPTVLFAAALILAMPPVCDEVWLSTTNSNFHIALAAALCLVLQVPQSGPARAALLLLAPLCGPASSALVPLFALRAWLDRDRGRAVQAACLTAGTLVQFLVFYTPLANRGHMLGPATLSAIFAVKHLAIPLLGEQAAAVMATQLHGDILSGRYPIAAMLAVASVAALLLVACLRRRAPEPPWLLLAGMAIALLSYSGALNAGPSLITTVSGNRYAYAPCMLFALAVLALAATGTDLLARGAWAGVVWLLAIAVQQTVLPQDPIFTQGPSWKAELRAWRANPAHPLAVWPAGWSLHLPPPA